MAWSKPDPERNVRRSWKEIADYLGVSVRAVQAWEKERGLPVHRLGTGTRARVFAFVDELEDWRSRAAVAPFAPRRRRVPTAYTRVLIGLLSSAVVGGLVWSAIRSADFRQPAVSRLEGHVLVVRDRGGRILWNREFPDSQPGAFVGGGALDRPITWVQDLDGDGRREVLFSLDPKDRNRASTLYVFESDGRLRWSYPFDQVEFFEDREFLGFRGHFLEFFESGGQAHLLAIARHHYFPSQLVLLDPASGEVVGRYLHPGHIRAYAVVESNGDRKLVVAGDNNPGSGLGHPFLAVLDLPLPPPVPDLPDLFGRPSVPPRRYLLFEKVDFCAALEEMTSPSTLLTDSDRVRVLLNACNRGTVQLDFDRDFTLRSVRFCDAYRAYHQEAFRSGLVDYPFDEEEERRLLTRVVEFEGVPDANSEAVARAFARCREEPGRSFCDGALLPRLNRGCREWD